MARLIAPNGVDFEAADADVAALLANGYARADEEPKPAPKRKASAAPAKPKKAASKSKK